MRTFKSAPAIAARPLGTSEKQHQLKLKILFHISCILLLIFACCRNQPNKSIENSTNQLDSTFVLNQIYKGEQDICFELKRGGLAKDDVPPGQELKYDSLVKALPNLKTCDPEILKFIIKHFRGNKTNVYHHCSFDYIVELKSQDSLLASGELNMKCCDLTLNGELYRLDTFNFNKIVFKLKEIQTELN